MGATLPVPFVLSALSSLRRQSLDVSFESNTPEEQQQLVAAIACSHTDLTCLEWDWGEESVPTPAQRDFLVAVAQLRQLRSLMVSTCDASCIHDITRLTALSGLTELGLYWCPALCDDVAVALVSGLTALKGLRFSHCGISGMVLPAIARLTCLESLSLFSDGVILEDADLQHFTGLTRLSYLCLPHRQRCTRAAVAQLQAHLPASVASPLTQLCCHDDVEATTP